MSFEKSKCNFIKKIKLRDEQIMLDSVISGTGSGDIKKIVWINAYPQIDTTEALTREISVSGKAVIEIVFLDEDNKICSAESALPFLTKFLNDSVKPSTKININAVMNDINFDERNAKISAVINFSIDITNMDEIELLNGGDDNICLKEDEIISQNLVKDDCITFNEELKLAINESFDKILSVNSDVVIKDIDCRNNFFVIQGEIITKIFYVVCGEIDQICFVSSTENFKREIETPALSNKARVEVEAIIKKENLKYETDNDGTTCNIIVNAPITLCFNVYDEINIPCATDLYSLKNNLDIVTGSFENTNIMSSLYFESRVEGSISLGDSEPRIDKMLGFSKGNSKITNQYIKDGEIVLEGIVGVDIMYLNDELQKINCVRKEIPFVVYEKTDAPKDFNICSRIVLCDVEVVARRGRELFIDAKIKANIRFFGSEKGTVITDAIMGEPLPIKEEAIEIYFAKAGDNLWEIAKELRTQPNVIIEQNPDFVNPLLENKNIIIYHQKNTNTSAAILGKKFFDY